MKVVAINGSARRDGNTAQMVRCVFAELEKEGIETELYQLAGHRIRGCMACYKCWDNADMLCVVKDDVINECIARMAAADGIILASPTYFADVTAEMKALIDRAGMVGRSNNDLFRRKVGAAVVAKRRGGAIHTLDTINHFFFITQMIVPGSRYWNMGIGLKPGEVGEDTEAVETMQVLGQNMAWLLKKLA